MRLDRSANRVYSDPADVQAFEAIASELSASGHVRLVPKDGGACEGVVAERVTMQAYSDSAGQLQSIDGELRLERPDEPDWHCWMWLDEIARVEHLDSTPGIENRAVTSAIG